jgi:primosomal protein N' (replication factor Y) (superfamily II helicase)
LTRSCRVLPDVPAVDRAFEYTVPERLAAVVRVGTIVRVPLHGRRVRGWVVADDVTPEASELFELITAVSAGPPADVVELSQWVAWRWAGPRVAVLRSASPPNIVPPTVWTDRTGQPNRTVQTVDGVRVVRWPPLLDRRALVADMCASEGSTIVCVADAGRARAFASYLARAGRAVALLHSAATDAARTEAWARASRGECVVVGGRIAALAAVPDLRAAIVVDDADEALQEERAPTWHARDVLRERAARAGAPFAVCSPAPTAEAVVAAAANVDGAASDVERTGWPRVEVLDRRDEPPGAGLLSEALAAALRGAPGLAVCVLNRRGRFRLLVCDSCRALLRWDEPERPVVCPTCGAAKLRVLRAGVRRIREELEALVPGRRVLEVDATAAEVPAADIVIGTEAVLHRTAVRRRRPALVAYLDLDQELLAPRYRAATQAHWLITRGAQLLASRPRSDTLLLLQTRVPDHVVVRAVARAAPRLLADAEIDYRRTLAYPPFGALAECSGDDHALAATVETLRTLDVSATGVQVFGPTDGRALVTAPTWDALADALAPAVPAGRARGRLRTVVDPPRV